MWLEIPFCAIQTSHWMSLGFSIITCRLGTTVPAVREIWEEQGSTDWKGLINGEGHETVHYNAGCWVFRTGAPHHDHSLFSRCRWTIHQTDAHRQYQVSHLLASNTGQTKASCILTPAHNSHQRLAGSSSYEAKSLKGPRYSSQPLLCQSQFAEIFYQCCGPLTS